MSLVSSALDVSFFDGRVRLEAYGPPHGDCVFIPTDRYGALGEDAHRIMAELGLSAPVRPDPDELERGYAIVRHHAGILVFVVLPKIGDPPVFERNLRDAFDDALLANVKETWIFAPFDHLRLQRLFSLLCAIRDSAWLERVDGQIFISTTRAVSTDDFWALSDALEHNVFTGLSSSNESGQTEAQPPLDADPKPGSSQPSDEAGGQTSSGTQQKESHSAEAVLDQAFRNRTLSFGDDLKLVLRRAVSFLRAQRTGKRKMRAHELLFVAAACGAPLTRDWSYEGNPLQRLAAALFGLLDDGKTDEFANAFVSGKGTGFVLSWNVAKDVAGLREAQLVSFLLEECSAWLRHAADIAVAAGRSEVGVGDFVAALWLAQSGSHVDLLGKLGIDVARLKQAFERVGSPPEPPLIPQDASLRKIIELLADAYVAARVQQVRRHLEHDLAAEEDRINYGPYADAFAAFLTDEGTSGPISISIQAPWGAGKSSLMQMIRTRIDVGWKQERPRMGATIGKVLKVLDDLEYRTGRIVHAVPKVEQGKAVFPQRLTVWFNAWKYENVEQVWAGLVDAIISQVSERLDPVERELFLLRLNMARIDDGVIRKKIHARIFSYWVASVGKVAGALLAFGLAALGIGSALGGAPGEHAEALNTLKHVLLSGAGASQLGLIAFLWSKFNQKQEKVKEEPATYSLAEYIREPDYDKSAGVIHQIHHDLRRVLDVLPQRWRDGRKVAEPIVIFIDDLDRCSPTKVASVVEGVNAFLASNLCECLFVIGMDPQMVAAALEHAHKDIKAQLPSYEQNVPMGWRYMDKFVQLPFTIPPAKKEHYRGFVDLLMSLGQEPADDAGVAVPEASAAASPTGGAQAGAGAAAVPAQVADAPVAQAAPGPESTTPLSKIELAKQARKAEGRKEAKDSVPGAPVGAETPSAKAAPAQPDSRMREKESRDTGILLGTILDHFQCSPREIKRYVNFIRLILILRRARQEKPEPVPTIAQYASWVVICLRWPDMARWLMWGSESLREEARTPSCNALAGLLAQRLHVMEEAARQNPDAWAEQAARSLGLPATGVPWLLDPDVREFFIKESAAAGGMPVSQGASIGFY